MSEKEIIASAIEAIIDGNEEKALAVARQAIELKLDLMAVLNSGFSEGIRQVGNLFERGEKFLPELIEAALIMEKVTDILNEAIMKEKATGIEKKGTMVIATVEGDVHDIGKGIVISMVKTQGVNVIDLGRDVSTDAIIAGALEHKADIIGTSALLTSTISQQKKLEDELRRRGLRERFKTIVGGAPVTQKFADKIGADAYAEDAAEAVVKVLELLERSKA
ncbi:MAG TPA: cobalamin-dependent protein [Bacillota bacterium]|nr:cobalamin-dependent protein [Bacillota bacterium]